MLEHVRTTCECFVTNVTLKRFLVVMNSLVSLHITSLGERFAAALKITDVGLPTVMNSLVFFERTLLPQVNA